MFSSCCYDGFKCFYSCCTEIFIWNKLYLDARNFLLRKNKALRANKENIDLVNKNKTELTKKNLQEKWV